MGKNVQKAFCDGEIVPNVIPQPPSKVLNLTYLYNGAEHHVLLGNELTPTVVMAIPDVVYKATPKDLYTLILMSPDVPSRANPIYAEFAHWLLVNIPGSEVPRGETVNEYVGACPPQESGMHRYIFLLFKQPSRITVSEPFKSNNELKNRGHFSTRKFCEKYSLEGPIAGNYFVAQYDDSVPLLLQQLVQL